jgi:hypothetical protein
VLHIVGPKQPERDLTFVSSVHTLCNNDRDASMIVEPKTLAVTSRPSITPVETPMHGSDRFFLTIANSINGESSQQQAIHAGIGALFLAKLRQSVSDHIFHSQFVSATTSRAMVAVAFSNFRILIRSMHALTLAATPSVLLTRTMLPMSTASGQKWGPISMRFSLRKHHCLVPSRVFLRA